MIKSDQTIKMITNETLRMAYQVGLENVKVSLIIHNLDINRGTFYRYFHDKYDVVNRIEISLMQQIKMFQQQIIHKNIHELRENLKEGLLFFNILELLDQNRELILFIFSSKGDIKFANEFEVFFHELNLNTVQRLNPLVSDKRGEIIATFITSAVIGLFRLHLKNPELFSKQDVLTASTKLFRHNLMGMI